MNIQARRESLMQWVASLNDPNLIAQLEEIARSHQESEEWNSLPQEVQEGIQRGRQDYLEGRVTPHEEAMERIRKKVGY